MRTLTPHHIGGRPHTPHVTPSLGLRSISRALAGTSTLQSDSPDDSRTTRRHNTQSRASRRCTRLHFHLHPTRSPRDAPDALLGIDYQQGGGTGALCWPLSARKASDRGAGAASSLLGKDSGLDGSGGEADSGEADAGDTNDGDADGEHSNADIEHPDADGGRSDPDGGYPDQDGRYSEDDDDDVDDDEDDSDDDDEGPNHGAGNTDDVGGYANNDDGDGWNRCPCTPAPCP